MRDALERAKAKAQVHLDAIAKLFVGEPKITLLIRHPDDTAGHYDFTLSTDDEDGVWQIVSRRFPLAANRHLAKEKK